MESFNSQQTRVKNPNTRIALLEIAFIYSVNERSLEKVMPKCLNFIFNTY